MLALSVPHIFFLSVCISPMPRLLDTDKILSAKKKGGQLFSESVHTNSFAGQVPNRAQDTSHHRVSQGHTGL